MTKNRTLTAALLFVTFATQVIAESSGTVSLALAGNEIDLIVDPETSGIFSPSDGSTYPVIEIFAYSPDEVDREGTKIHLKFDVAGAIPTPEINLTVVGGPATGIYYLESDWRKAIFTTEAFGQTSDGVIIEGNLNGHIDAVDDASNLAQEKGVPILATINAIVEQKER